MVPNANARHFRIKAAQRDLISAAGGIVRAAQITNFSKSEVGRWNDIDSPDWMDLVAVDKLEAETGLRVFTQAWVETRGLKLADVEPDADKVAGLAIEVAGLVADFSTLMGEWAVTSADGHATTNEAIRLRRQLPALRERISRLEGILAAVQAEGGLSLVSGGAA